MNRLARIILRLHGKSQPGSLLRYEDERVEITGEASRLVYDLGEIFNLEVAERLAAGPYYDERIRTILFVHGSNGQYKIQHCHESTVDAVMEHLLRLVPLEALADVDGQ